ncbi:metal ABC transporter permease [Paeniglutamicibacter sulfureus]|uniref:Manganese/iron transport system permease protein n=1 Tax=Paeniglutamicibacter sulfureus TaxID=43666 RepID=A0ABU2BLG1_9MICC|nr:metal ABC transporter permease [Paeniglutamicibacter sulfureus]MDO2935175.1 metal ABC transporter permease [Paeniglutamicibacter sulfureus]MDR7359487.1 manganese/iron transport system permease protein [Paeniglutamicibacter sulfureus]
MNLVDTLMTAFSLPFMNRAALLVIVLAVLAATVGLFVNLRGLEFMGDALVHAVFPGLAVGLAVAGEDGLVPGAFIAALLGSVILTLISRRGVAQDAALAIVLAGMFSVGVAVVSTRTDYSAQLEALLFGRMLAIPESQLIETTVIAVMAVVLLFILWRVQIFRAVDPNGSQAAGYRPVWIDLSLNVAIALAVVATAGAVGNLIVLAVIIIPVAVARLISRRLLLLPLIALGFALGAMWLGLAITYIGSVEAGLDLPSGATIVMTLVLGYLLVFFGRTGIDALQRRRGRARAASRAPESSQAGA